MQGGWTLAAGGRQEAGGMPFLFFFLIFFEI
jgi:hypothetical protein